MRVKRLDRVPPQWAKAHLASARALLLAEQRAQRDLRRAVLLATARAAMLLRGSTSKIQAIAVIRHAVREVAASAENAIHGMRQNARRVAIQRLDAELTLLRRELGEDGPDTPLVRRPSEDDVLAHTAAAPLASAWGVAALHWTLRWADRLDVGEGEANASGAADAAMEHSEHRIRRIAATETSRAYNDEHDEGLRDIAENNKDARWLPLLFKRWDATLDRTTCVVCRAHDGELAVIGFAFSDDDEPGEVHANCRCLDTLVFLPVPLHDAAAAEDDEAA